MKIYKFPLLMVLLAGPMNAQDLTSDALTDALERPSHDALMTLIARPETTLAPFHTDGCSGGMSLGWRMVASIFPDFAKADYSAPPWEKCCVTHDRAYHSAGQTLSPQTSFQARLTADLALKACIIATGPDQVNGLAYDGIAQAMFLAVRLGGYPCTSLPWRWGYGYPYCSVLTSLAY